LAVEKVVGCCVGVGDIETPAWFTLGVRAHNRYREVRLKVLKVSDQVWTMSEGAKEA
jgi:hypothetical protein